MGINRICKAIIVSVLVMGSIGAHQCNTLLSYASEIFLSAYDITGKNIIPSDAGYYESFSSITFYPNKEELQENEYFVYALSEDNGLWFSGFSKVENNYLILTPPEDRRRLQTTVLQFLIQNGITGETRMASDNNCLYRIQFDTAQAQSPKAKLATGSKVRREDKVYIRGVAPVLYTWPCNGMKTYVTIDDGSQSNTYSLTNEVFRYTFPEGIYKIAVWSEDVQGKRIYAEDIPEYFCYDNSEPTDLQFQLAMENKEVFQKKFLDYQFFSRDGICLKIECSDYISGIFYYEYKYKSISGNVIQKKQDNLLSIMPYFKGKIYVRAFDRAGNSTKWMKFDSGLVVENNKPSIEIEDKNGEDKWNSGNVNFKIRIVDRDSGIASVVCSINGEKELTKEYKKGKSPLEICVINLEAVQEADNEEGIELEIFAYDNAGNCSRKTKLFYIDKTAPEIEMKEISNGEYFCEDKELEIWIKEKIFRNGVASIRIYEEESGERKLCQEESFGLTDEITRKQVQVERDGKYTVEVSACDAAGNQSEQKTIQFCKDTIKPKVDITGTPGTLVTDKEVQGICRVEDINLQEENVQISATRYDCKGKVLEEFAIPVEQDEKGSYGKTVFRLEGNYRLKIYASDQAGNETISEKSFTIDRNPPVIHEIKEYDGSYMKNFCLSKAPEELMEDYGIAEYALYLNGEEYDGTTVINQEGKYILTFFARDEWNHESRETATFIIDHTPPEIQIDGKKNFINIKVKNFRDEIKEVLINGKKMAITGDGRYYVKTPGDYEISALAYDKAGNITKVDHRRCHID